MHGNPRLPLVPTPPATDTLTLRAEVDDQVDNDRDPSAHASGPYRDGADAKLARMRNLEAWLARLDEAEAMRGTLERERRLLEESIRHERDVLRARVTQTTRCSVKWQDMQGDDAVRRCGRCHREVHDLARLSRNDAEAVLARAQHAENALHTRPDGRVVMGACPRSERAQTVRAVAAGVIAGAAVVTSTIVPYAIVDDMRFEALAARVGEGERTTHRLHLEQRHHDARLRDAEGHQAESEQHASRARQSLRDSIAHVARAVASHGPGAESVAAGAEVIALGPNEYLVTRETLERPTPSLSRVRAVPHERHGVALGVRVYGLAPSSLPSRLGIQNGDTLVTLNGISLATHRPDELLAVMRDSTSFDLVVLRDGEVVRLRYTILG